MNNRNIPYRADGLAVRDTRTNEFHIRNPKGFSAIEAVPEFAARWAADAALKYGNDKVLTGTINASGACPIGANALCGAYCFAHTSWSNELSPRGNIADQYSLEAQRLQSEGEEIGIFMSYDTEPFPGGVVTEISKGILRAMLKYPPAALLVHSHTADVGKSDVVSILADVSQATDLIVGIGFETDAEDLLCGRKHHHTVRDRLSAIEALANAGVKTQASTTPLLGFIDFRGFVTRFANMGTHRIMTGELRKEFSVGGSTKAAGLELGLPIPTEEEALNICREFNFPGGADVREIFYVTMT